MGAAFQSRVFPGDLKKEAVRSEFEDLQERDRYDNGHSYSGGFGMARGLQFRSETFPTVDDAEEWLAENAQKWEAALAVRAREVREKLWGETPNPNFNTEVWIVGAWCAC